MNRAELAALEAAATPGPWFAEPRTAAGRVWVQLHRRHPDLGPIDDLEPLFNVRSNEGYAQRAADAEFIAACRTAVPVLLRRLDLAEQALAALAEGHCSVRWEATGDDHRTVEAISYCNPPCTHTRARAALAELRRPLDQPDPTT